MAIEPQRTSWPDERLDDLNQVIRDGFERTERDMRALRTDVDERFNRVDERFNRVDERFNRVDERFNRVEERFNRVEERFNRVDERFDRIDERFGSLQRTMIVGLFGLSGALLTVLGAALLKLG